MSIISFKKTPKHIICTPNFGVQQTIPHDIPTLSQFALKVTILPLKPVPFPDSCVDDNDHSHIPTTTPQEQESHVKHLPHSVLHKV